MKFKYLKNFNLTISLLIISSQSLFSQNSSNWFSVNIGYGENLISNNDFVYQYITPFFYANTNVQAEQKKVVHLNLKLSFSKTEKEVAYLHSYGVGVGLSANTYFVENGVFDNSSDYALDYGIAPIDFYPTSQFELEKKILNLNTFTMQGVSINKNKIRINNSLLFGLSLDLLSSSKHRNYNEIESKHTINPILDYSFSLSFGGKQNNKWNVGMLIPFVNYNKEHFIFTNVYQKTFTPKLQLGLKI